MDLDYGDEEVTSEMDFEDIADIDIDPDQSGSYL